MQIFRRRPSPCWRALLEGISPGADPISLAIGDPQGTVPAFVTEAILRHADKFGVYPPINATGEWREAASGWLMRRFALPAIDPDTQVLPLNGTREGLFLAPFIVTPEAKGGGRPVILLPNPFYQCYAAAALSCGAEPVFVRADASTRLPSRFRFSAQSRVGAHRRGLSVLALQSGRCLRRARPIGERCSHSPTATTLRCSPMNVMRISILIVRRLAH